MQSGGRRDWRGRERTWALVADVGALLVAVLCPSHATARIVRGIRASYPESYSSMNTATTNSSSNSSSSTHTHQNDKKQHQRSTSSSFSSSFPASLTRKDSVYGGSPSSRLLKDLLLLLLLILSITSLLLTHPPHGNVIPITMMSGLALLFSYKPLRALREAKEEFIGQMLLLQILVKALWPSLSLQGGRRRRRGSSKGGGGGREGGRKGGREGDHDYIFDERDLSAATRPEALAAEVMRLRRKVAEMEEKMEEEQAAAGTAAAAAGEGVGRAGGGKW